MVFKILKGVDTVNPSQYTETRARRHHFLSEDRLKTGLSAQCAGSGYPAKLFGNHLATRTQVSTNRLNGFISFVHFLMFSLC